jgi:hypothetical protein
MGTSMRVQVSGSRPARSRSRAHLAIITSKPRPGARIRTAVRRCFILAHGQPITGRMVLERAFPRLKRFIPWHYKSAYRALRQVATIIACHRSRGRPNLWSPKETFGEVRSETTAKSTD